MKTLISILLFAFLEIYSQGFLKLYKDELPDHLLKDELLKNSIELNLQRNVLLNPELIYYTIVFYQQLDTSNFNSDQFDDLKSREKKWLIKRSQWAAEIINDNNLNDKSHQIEDSFKKLLTDVKLNENDKASIQDNTERNLSDFYIVKYYNQDPELKYNAATDYGLIREQLEILKRQYFNDVHKNPALISSPSEIINNLIKHWYLLEEDENFNSAGFLTSVITDISVDESRKRFSFRLGNVFYNNIRFEESLNFPGIDQPVLLNKSESFPQLSFSMGYKIYLAKEQFLFSYLDIQALFAFGYAEVNREESIFYNSSEISGNVQTDTYIRNFQNKYKLTALNTYGMNLSMPVYRRSSLMIEASARVSYNNYKFVPDMYFLYSKYKITYNSTGQQIRREAVTSGAKTINEEVSKSYFSVIPTLDLTYLITSGLNIQSCFSYNYVSLNLGFNTALF